MTLREILNEGTKAPFISAGTGKKVVTFVNYDETAHFLTAREMPQLTESASKRYTDEKCGQSFRCL